MNFENVQNAIKVKLTINGPEFSTTKELTIVESGLLNITFELPVLKNDVYNFEIELRSDIWHTRRINELTYADYKPIIAIETDSNIYIGAEFMEFCIYFFDENLHALNEVPDGTEVIIYDAKNNIVENFKNLPLVSSRSCGLINIFANPKNAWGQWRLEVKIKGALMRQAFLEVWKNEADFVPSTTESFSEPTMASTNVKTQDMLIDDTNIEFLEQSGNKLKFEIKQKDVDKHIYKVNETIELLIKSEERYDYYVYHIIGRGRILKSERILFTEKQNTTELKIDITENMAPYCRIFVHFINEHGIQHYDEMFVYVEPMFQNEVQGDAAYFKHENQNFKLCTLQLKIPAKADFPSILDYTLTSNTNDAEIFLKFSKNNDYNEFTQRDHEINIENLLDRLGGFDLKINEITSIEVVSNFLSVPALRHPKINKNRDIKTKPKHADSKSTAKTTIYADDFKLSGQLAMRTKIDVSALNNITIVVYAFSKQKGFGYARAFIESTKSYIFAAKAPYKVVVGEIICITMQLKSISNIKESFQVSLEDNIEFELINPVESEQHGNEDYKTTYYMKPLHHGLKKIIFTITTTQETQQESVSFKVEPANDENKCFDQSFLLNEKLKNLDIKELLTNSQHVHLMFYSGLLAPFFQEYSNKDNKLIIMEHNEIEKALEIPVDLQRLTAFDALTSLSVYLELFDFYRRATFDKNLQHFKMFDTIFQTLMRNLDAETGGFYFFGKEENASIWLTAAVARILPSIRNRAIKNGKSIYKLEDTLFEKTLSFLSSQQHADGSFIESGEIIDDEYQNDTILTAQVLLALLENGFPFEDDCYNCPNFTTEISKATEYLLAKLNEELDFKTKLLAIYALQKSKHSTNVSKYLETIKLAAKESENFKWWNDREGKPSIEITALSFLTLIETASEDAEDYLLPILRWLIEIGNVYKKQANFPSPTTAIVIRSINAYYIKMNEALKHHGFMHVQIKEGSKEFENYVFNHLWPLYFASFKLPNTTHEVETELHSQALAVLRISSQCEDDEQNFDNAKDFKIKVDCTPENIENPLEVYNLNICLTYIGPKTRVKLTIVDIAMPSGYEINADSLGDIYANKYVKAIVAEEKVTRLKIFLLGLKNNEENCHAMKAKRVYSIVLLRSAKVKVYEYNDYENGVTALYTIPSIACAVCEKNENCLESTISCSSIK